MPLAAWQATIVDESGNVQAGASIEVRRESTGTLAAIYADRDGNTPLSNPFFADSSGFARFHVSGGAFRITATKGSFSRTWRYVGIGLASEYDDLPSTRVRYDRTAAEISAGVTPSDYAYEPISVRRFVTSGSGTPASPFVVDTDSIQDLIDDGLTDTTFVFDPGYWYEIKELTVTSAGRSADSSLGGIYRAGIYFLARGASVRLASGEARAITFTDVSDFGVVGGNWTGSPTEAFWKVSSTGAQVRTFSIAPSRVKGGAISGSGTDGVGLLIDSTGGNIANFHIGGGAQAQWTHLRDCIYMKNDAPGAGIDTGIVEMITGWPYGTDSEAGYTIRCEAAVDVIFRRIYGGLFEHDEAAAIFLNPKYTEGIRNCTFEVVSADVSSGKTNCRTIRAVVNDANKPIEGCVFGGIKMNRASTGTPGNNALSVATTNNAEFRRNLIYGIASNDTGAARALVLGQYSNNNCIIPTGNIDTKALTSWISDAGYRNVIMGLNPAMLASANGRTTVTAGGTTSVKFYTLRGGTLGPSDAIRISINGTIATNANGVTIAVMFGSSTVATSTISGGQTGVFRIDVEIANQGATNSQRWHSRMFRDTALISHGAGAITEDTTNDLTIRVDVTLAEPPGSDTVNVDSRNVELLNATLS